MLLSSEDVSPFAAPGCGIPNRESNRQANLQFSAMFESVQDDMNAMLQMCGAEPMPQFFLDCWYTLPDRFLQFTAEDFEYQCWAGCIIDTSGAPRKSSTQMMPLSGTGVPYDGNAVPPT
jgi:hypothetical protein